MRKFFRKIIDANWFEILIQMIIILNSLTLGSQYYGQPCWWGDTIENLNLAFTIIFTIECIMKLIGMGFIEYQKDYFNLFDFVVVIAALIEFFFEGSGFAGLSILRGFRILRIFKLIKKAKSLQLLVK